ncbi:MAG: FHA domain-containing protein [Pirellulales bacterium]|nr:FHA domain-containing protein [Pirellulales bacterium]
MKLIVIGGKASKGEVSLTPPTVLGRSRDAGLAVGHPMISRRHCEVIEQNGLLMVRDLGSLNGTYVGGRRVREAPLPPGARFSIGPLTFRVDYEYAGDLNALPPVVPEVADTTDFARQAPAKPDPAAAAPASAPADNVPAAPTRPAPPAAAPAEPPADEELDELDFELVEDPAPDDNSPNPGKPTPPNPGPADGPPGDPLDPEAQALDDFLKGID